ncbi:electron transport complex subunit RsxG [Enterobacteriales bacterium SAP-6]|uniref:Ion-translocating oxidoreductase complex subunit G n=2 Tax=Acerihabitans arboris TaxID=2691583 RepID=A0A845SIW3_9GAMM|nr:electron transport complex subunit RsxG [Acerihabitans arboris]
MLNRAAAQYLPARESPFTQGFLLGSFTLVVCLLVAGCWWLTHEQIVRREKEDTQAMLSQVFPAGHYDNALADAQRSIVIDGRTVSFFRASLNGQPSGIVLASETQGYGGPIQLLTGIDAKGVITGVRVISHKETPGLGDAIELGHSPWIRGFDGKSLNNLSEQQWHVKKDGGQFDAFTGATITPRAVVKGVHENLVLYREKQAEFLGSQDKPDNGGAK